MAGFRYPFDIQSTLDPWRHQLGGSFDQVVSALADRDRALEDFLGTWRKYTPAWQNLTIGNATVTSAYTVIGGTVHYRGLAILGSTSSVGTTPRVSLPVLATPNFQIGSCSYTQTGTTTWMGSMQNDQAGGNFGTFLQTNSASAGGGLSATVPFTWAAGHKIAWSITYDAA